MTIGCNALYPWGELTTSDRFTVEAYREALANLVEAGFEAVEFSHISHFGADEASAIGERARSLGLSCWSCHAEGPSGFDLAPTADEVRRALCHCLDLCAATGSRVLVVHAPFGSARPDLSIAAEAVAALDHDRQALEPACRHAESLGLRIALENLRDVAQMRYIVRLREAVGAECLGFCIDTGHAALHDLGPARAVHMAGERLYTTHIHDNHGANDSHMPPGMGSIDWPGFFAALREEHYEGTLMLELTDKPSDRPCDQKRELARGAAAVRSFA